MQNAEGTQIREIIELQLIIVEVDESEHVEATAGAIELMLERFHKKKDYQIDVPLALLQQAEATKRTFNIVLGSIAGISLLVGGIGIMNIMLASVTERTREIGIRRAIGARQGQIITQFLIETVVLSALGGIIGILAGFVLPWIITWLTRMPTIITLWSVLLSFGISVAIGIVFGLYPAYRAAASTPSKRCGTSRTDIRVCPPFVTVSASGQSRSSWESGILANVRILSAVWRFEARFLRFARLTPPSGDGRGKIRLIR